MNRTNILKKCANCPRMFRVGWGSRVYFCNGAPGDLVDAYSGRPAVFADFVKTVSGPSCNGYRKVSLREEAIPSRKKILDSPLYKKPSFLYLMLNYKCSNNCLFCYLGNKKRDPGPSLMQLHKIIEAAPEEKITLFGGEPTLNEHLFEIIRYLEKKGKRIKITTNARRFAENTFSSMFFLHDFDQVTVSLHSHRKEDHNYLTRTRSFNETIEGIRNIVRYKKEKTKVRANIVINRVNFKDLKSLSKMAVDLGVDRIRFNSLGVTLQRHTACNKELAVNQSSVVPYLAETLEYLESEHGQIRRYVSNHPLCYFSKKLWPYFSNKRLYLERHSDELDIYEKGTTSATLSEKCVDCSAKKQCPGFYYSSLLYFGQKLKDSVTPI